MTSNQIRQAFLDYFETQSHKIVPSAPLVVKNDPTLMFTNAGMNQFKDLFLGNTAIIHPRIANSQKCLRVSGKHNDLEEVGHDTYHHTMFEMLGNWSFGDYFKKEAIDWGWNFLTGVMKINPEWLYATVFEGNKDEGLEPDLEALEYWKKYLPQERILFGSKKDNFWEMGDTGPCGPCSEVHVDIRNADEKLKISGDKLVNNDHPQVIEVWNLVFIQYNRKADGSLEVLPSRHVDTGMGFERLCMVVQGKQSNYDTDVFQPIIQEIARLSGKKYGQQKETDIAMRVIADHLRTLSFAIADGQLPSNAKAGYVIRRILRRGIRYAYTFLEQTEPFIYKLIPVLIANMGTQYPEIKAQKELIEKVMLEEEHSFLRTLETGIKLLDKNIKQILSENKNLLSGKDAFELYDTYGFPLDLTELILRDHNMTVNRDEYNAEMNKQKQRSQADAQVETGDWNFVHPSESEQFVGYDNFETECKITRFRTVKSKGKEFYHIILNNSPFYAESGGQAGDTGYLECNGHQIEILDTVKENNLNIQITDKIPENPQQTCKAVVNIGKRTQTMCNHSATHLMHYALRTVLGTHVEQKGSMVNSDYLRFDFSHFGKMTDEEISRVEKMVNDQIRANINLDEKRNVPMLQAQEMGAMALFGEKYGDQVRVIKFGNSVELCGGTHINATGRIGYFKILSESAIASGIRRIEAITSDKASEYIQQNLDTVKQLKHLFKAQKDVVKSVEELIEENNRLKKQIEAFGKEKMLEIKQQLINSALDKNNVKIISGIVTLDNKDLVKDLAFQLKQQFDNAYIVLGTVFDEKPLVTVALSDQLIKDKNLNATNIIRAIASEIEGGGGGQPFYATAGGKNVAGLPNAVNKAVNLV